MRLLYNDICLPFQTQINHLASLRVVVYDHDSGNSDDLVESFSHDVLITEVDIVTKEAWRVTLDRRTRSDM